MVMIVTVIVKFAAYNVDVDTMLMFENPAQSEAYVRSAVFSSRSERLGRDFDGRLGNGIHCWKWRKLEVFL